MKKSKSKTGVRIGILVNYICVLALVSLWEYYEMLNYAGIIRAFCLIPLLIIIVSFIMVYWKTGTWHFMHKSVVKLDERELQLVGRTLRSSYAIFTVIILLVLLLFSIFERPLSIVMVVSLIYIAHIIPVSIIAWKDRLVHQ